MNDLSERPEREPRDARELLSAAAQRRIDQAYIEGSKGRDAVLKTYRYDDPVSELALAAASFNYAFLVLSVKFQELKYAGARGDDLGQIMAEEIEAAVNSLGLGLGAENYLAELLLFDWGW